MCGLSTRNTLTPQSTQWSTTLEQRLPQPAPVRRLPVDVVDVLVALGRVLGVLERAVGAVVKPLGVLGQPRVVGRALDREVERDVDRRARAAAVGQRAAGPRSCRARGGPRRGRRSRRRSPTASPGSLGPGDQRVVAALAVGVADRVDRRQVDDVEAELGEPRELLLDALRARPTSAGTARTRRRTGPAAGRPRSRAARSARPRRGAPARARPRRTAPSPSATSCLAASGIVVVARACAARARSAALGRRSAALRLRPPAAAATPSESSPAEIVLAGRDLALELVAPGAEHVGPGLDRVLPAARSRSTANSPAQRTPSRWASIRRISASRQRRFAGAAVADDGAQQVVAVAEHVGGDGDGVADAPLGRVTAVVDRRRGILDHRSAAGGWQLAASRCRSNSIQLRSRSGKPLLT